MQILKHMGEKMRCSHEKALDLDDSDWKWCCSCGSVNGPGTEGKWIPPVISNRPLTDAEKCFGLVLAKDALPGTEVTNG